MGAGWQQPGPRSLSIYVDKVPQHSPAEMTEVLLSVETLYNDELKPYGRILRKRLTERAQHAGHGDIDIDVGCLRALCEASPWLDVRAESGEDWSASLCYRASCFVDVYSPRDPYPAELWNAAATYFSNLNEAEMVLPGGRYLCARVLVGRGLPFLAGRSLGQVCHIVQLAISQKKLLGYTNGSIVPYKHSQSMVKERCAQSLQPCRGRERETTTVTSWDALRDHVRELLGSLPPGERSVPLSSLKRLFQSHFRVELSETSLGYAKLSELFQDARLQDVCEVRLQGHGYVLLPTARAGQGKRISLVESLGPSPSTGASSPAGAGPAGNSSLRNRARWIEQLSPEDLATPLEPSAPAVPYAPQIGQIEGDGAAPAQHLFPPTPSPCFGSSWQLPRLLGSKGAGGWGGAEKRGALPLHGGLACTAPQPQASGACAASAPAALPAVSGASSGPA